MKIASPSSARDIVRVDVGARRDIHGRGADRAPVFQHGLPRANEPQGNLVASRRGLDDRNPLSSDVELAPRVEWFKSSRDVVAGGNDQRRRGRHWLTPLARKPPSTARICPVTKVDASDAR